MTAPVVEAVDIAKWLGTGAAQVQALKGVSLTLRGGELTLLMGPSGSGKTTLLSILGCMLTPTRGTIFQSYHLFPTLTAADNVRLALDVRGDNSARALAKTKDALAMVGLAHKAEAFPLELSGGEQQRIAIARAIVGQPSAILADEPTASLDGENGNAVMTLLAEIAKDRSRGVLVVAHDPRILRFADRVVHIEDGCIVREERGGAVLKKDESDCAIHDHAEKHDAVQE
ncbi:MAG: ABC transporter ATP-binding protein [Alphaproteobacteria bacterium]|nr:MAG: ABC transporter ATP-binding protein [Alphaproteobacteria bacterium]